jgi:HPt (histidine-containing phosphotransfer) domain-containing protein
MMSDLTHRDTASVPPVSPQAFQLDPAALARLRELDPTGESQLLTRVLRAFQTSVARLMPQLEAARRVGDRATIRLVAHTLKSSSASVGALELSKLCAQVESLTRVESADDLDPPFHAMHAAVESTLNAIQRLLGGPA